MFFVCSGERGLSVYTLRCSLLVEVSELLEIGLSGVLRSFDSLFVPFVSVCVLLL